MKLCVYIDMFNIEKEKKNDICYCGLRVQQALLQWYLMAISGSSGEVSNWFDVNEKTYYMKQTLMKTKHLMKKVKELCNKGFIWWSSLL